MNEDVPLDDADREKILSDFKAASAEAQENLRKIAAILGISREQLEASSTPREDLAAGLHGLADSLVDALEARAQVLEARAAEIRAFNEIIKRWPE